MRSLKISLPLIEQASLRRLCEAEMLACQTATTRQVIMETETALRKIGVESPRREAEILLEEVTRLDKLNLYLKANNYLSPSQHRQIIQMVGMREQGIPVQYITGKAYFRDIVLKITPEVLIPRPETEQLVELVLQKCKEYGRSNIKIADVGTGSGAIAVSLAKEHPFCNVAAIDISRKALNVALQNAHAYGVAERINFLNASLLDVIDLKVDIIVANLPYIPSAQLPELPIEVKMEPSIALAGGDRGYDLIEELIVASPKKLKKQGSLFLEAGIGQADDIANIISLSGFRQAKVLKDYSGIDRYIIGEL